MDPTPRLLATLVIGVILAGGLPAREAPMRLPPAVGVPLTFTLTDVVLPAAPRQVAAFDVDGDGAPELVVLGSPVAELEGQVTVLDNDGQGGFSIGWTTAHPGTEFAFAPMWMDQADVDLDGDLDLSITPAADDHSIRLNDGLGTLSAFLHGTWFGGFAGAGSFVEVDGDGLPDLAHFTDDRGPFLDAGLGQGDGRFVGFAAWIAPPYDQTMIVHFADLDEDGDNEPVVSSIQGLHTSHDFGVWTELLDGAFESLRVLDLDDDRHLDLVFTDPENDRLGVLLGDGSGAFGPPIWFETGREPTLLVLADMDGDGQLDAITSNADAGSISILRGNGAGSFGTKQDVATGPDPLGLAAADFDLDGDTDLAVADTGATTITVLLQQ